MQRTLVQDANEEKHALFQIPICGISAFLLLFVCTAMADTITIVNDVAIYSSLSGDTVNMSGVSELHLTSASTPLSGCTINLNSVDSFLFFENIAPSTVNTSTYLNQIKVSGANAVLNTTIRIVQYVNGTVVIPHSSGFQPLQIFSGYNYTGSSMSLSKYTYYTNSSLGSLNDNIRSFKLKRGYMATFAENGNASGISLTYVAQDSDINIRVMPEELNDAISFIRVFPWRWTSKKGWVGGGSGPGLVDAGWNYDYNNEAVSTLDREYIPQRHNPNWNAYSNINNKQNSTHALGFNEPDNPDDDGYSTVAGAIAAWPAMLASGLRLVSPGPRDSGTSWLYDFVDQADALNYRVDAVAIHYYRDNESISTIRNWLAGIHNRTGRRIWVTEWNDGCNWTGGDPTDPYAHADRIIEMAEAMDDMPFVERYSVYSACSNRELISGSTLTPAGIAYEEHNAPMAYLQAPGKGGIGCAAYDFEDSTADSSFYANDGVAHGSESYTTGHSGRAIDLDGSEDYVMLPANLADSADFTFAAWIYWDGGNQWQRIFDFGANSLRYMFLTPRSGGNTLRFAITTGSGEQSMETSQLASGQWVHVAVTLSGDTGRLFVNGSQAASNTAMTLNPSDLKALTNYLGRSHFAQDPLLNGRLDKVRIGNYALTNSEIADLYNGTAGNIAPGFTADPFITSPIVPGSVFNDTLFYKAGDIDATGLLTFSKTSGPAWLTVASDGTLSGTPAVSDTGDNSFTIRATDAGGAGADITVIIPVSGFGLQNHYEFEGDTSDSIAGADGTTTGSPVYEEGFVRQALNLDGGDDFVTLPPDIIYSEDVTIAAWVWWNGGSIWQRIFDFGSGENQYLFLTPRSSSNTLRFGIKNGGSEQLLQTSQLATGQWVHVAVTLDGNTGRLYVNGSPADTNASMTLNPTDLSLTSNYIGDSQWTADPLFNGRIDDFRIYNYALSSSEVATLAMQTYLASTKMTIVGHTAGAEESGNPGQNSYDGDGVTRWANTGSVSNAWIKYDLGAVETVDRVQISFNNGQTRTFPLRIDVDGTVVFNGNTSTSDGYWATTFEPVSGRYVTLTMTGNNSDNSGWFSIWETEIWASAFPPTFTANPISNDNAIELTDYTGQSLAHYADDVDGIETLTFSKDAGPDWLVVESDGTVSGIPSNAHIGENIFTVRVTDHTNLSDTATMTIDVANVYSGTQGLEDLTGLAAQWLAVDCGLCDGADLSGDTNVDIVDLDLLAYRWLADETLRLHLPFEEGVGTTTADHSIFAETAVLVNGPAWTTGHAGGALSFDGVDDYVEVTGYKGIPGTASRTCMAWVKTSAVSKEILTWGSEPSNGARWIIRINETGTLRAEVQGGNIIGTTPINDGTWHHIAVVLEDDGDPDITEARLYVDGNLETISASVDEPVNSGSFQNVRIGMYYVGKRYFTGLIDDVRIYSTALSEQEIQNLSQ